MMTQELSPTELLLLQITRNFLQELKMERGADSLKLNSSLEADLGLGSLERAELFRRIELEFSVQFPHAIISEAGSLQDFVGALKNARPVSPPEIADFAPQLEEVSVNPSDLKSLNEILAYYAQLIPDRPHIYFQDEHGKEQIITYSQLFNNAKRVSSVLREHRIKPGDTIAIMLPTCTEFFSVFFGVLLAGAIPVPIYPPVRRDQIENYLRRQSRILKNAEIRLLITFAEAQALSQLLKTFIPSLYAVLNATELLKMQPGKLLPLQICAEALIQYTSGSTGDPKGVLLTHANLLANIRAIGKGLQIQPSDAIISWLPLYHDMGLIGAWLGSLYFAVPLTIFSPLTFLTHPERWLWAIHYHRGTLSASPNFGYELCVNKISDQQINGLDLSSWRLALNGAEAVHASTIRKFTQKFSAYRFNPKSMMPVYGLAESSVALIFPALDREPKIDRINRDIFIQQNRAEPVSQEHKSILEIPSCGQPIPGHSVRIVDENNQPLSERQVGSLQFKGPSATSGYYHNSAATQALKREEWLETGDFAYQADGEIYITGRKKDIIISAGRNIPPEEIEKIAGKILGVRKGCVVAFSVSDSEKGTEICIVAAETQEKDSAAREKIIDEIIHKVTATINVSPQVILLAPCSIPKTSSGKLQRSACKQAYLENKLTKRQLPVWWQLGRIFLKSFGRKSWDIALKISKSLYTGYAIVLVIITLLPLRLIIIPCSSKTSFKLVGHYSRLILKLLSCRLTVEGQWPDLKNNPAIIIVNHSSYVDVLVLLAALPFEVSFIAKKELIKVPILKGFIHKLKCLLIDRLDFSQSLEDSARIQKTLAEGRSLVIFPEGTFTYAAGLRAFKLGAFKMAVETKVPLLPLGLQGTRRLLPDENIILTPSTLKIKIGPLLIPEGQNWNEAARLRDLSRQQISTLSGERIINIIAAGLAGR